MIIIYNTKNQEFYVDLICIKITKNITNTKYNK